MSGNKPTVYIETSVISYLTARGSRDLIVAANQQITREWWETVLPSFDAFISPIVLEEISKGNTQAAELRLAQVLSFPLLELSQDTRILARTYFEALQLPESSRADSYHLALASLQGIDFLVSWNCTHIVSGRVRTIIEAINTQSGLRTPIICTPAELMEV